MVTFWVSDAVEQEHVLIQITDTHLLDSPQHEFVGMNPEETFHAVMDMLKLQQPHADVIIHTGDLAQTPTPTSYQRYLDYMQNLSIPFYQTPGNHDDEAYFPFHHENPQEPCVIALGKWRIILLNSAQSHRVDGNISTEQLIRLEQLLTEYQDHYVLLACHHHPFSMHSAWIDQHILKNASDFLNTIQPYPNIRAIICGHVHQNAQHQWHGIQLFSTPSTCIQFKPKSENFALDDSHPGYRLLRLKANGDFETEVFRLQNVSSLVNKEISGY